MVCLLLATFPHKASLGNSLAAWRMVINQIKSNQIKSNRMPGAVAACPFVSDGVKTGE